MGCIPSNILIEGCCVTQHPFYQNIGGDNLCVISLANVLQTLRALVKINRMGLKHYFYCHSHYSIEC